jgi:NAD(P)-dependent dehydrogenase (short-subunit alcohol dehydrogenase family)
MRTGGKCLIQRNPSLASPPAAIVTGGAGEGIGHGITAALLDDNWAVLVVDRDPEKCHGLMEQVRSEGKPIEVMVADIRSPDTARHAVEIALRSFGRLDGLVNNAGVGLCKPIAEITDEEFDRLVDIDFRAAFRFSRAAIPAMNKNGGAIVNIGSVHARQTISGFGAYGSIKAAVEGLTRAIAVDHGPEGIRANCVHPGMVESPQNQDLIRAFHPDPDEWISHYTKTKQVISSPITARQVGDLVAWLLSSKAVSITGQSVVIDGGSTAMLYDRGGQA